MSEIDEIVARYSRRRGLPPLRYSYFDPANLFIAQNRERDFLEALNRAGIRSLAGVRILDVGCGYGGSLLDMLRWGAAPDDLFGVELIAERADICGARIPGAHIRVRSAEHLDFPDGHFDIVVQSTMFSSVHDADMRLGIAEEMARVTARSGLLLWYDLRRPNPANADVRPIGRKELRRLFPDFRIRLSAVTLAPPVVRVLAPRARLVCELLARLPILRTHYLAVMRRFP